MKHKLRADREANYDFYEKRDPTVPMGATSFANLPTEPMVRYFSREHEHRDGITNSFTCDVEMISDMNENRK